MATISNKTKTISVYTTTVIRNSLIGILISLLLIIVLGDNDKSYIFNYNYWYLNILILALIFILNRALIFRYGFFIKGKPIIDYVLKRKVTNSILVGLILGSLGSTDIYAFTIILGINVGYLMASGFSYLNEY